MASPPLKFAKSDSLDLGVNSVIAAAAAVGTWALGKMIPSMPSEIQIATVIAIFGGIKFAISYFSDTRRDPNDPVKN